GKAPVIKELAKYHTGSSVVIWIPALNLYYVGEGSGPNLRLTPIADDSRLQLRAGVATSARDVFNQLVPIANNLKPQFPTQSPIATVSHRTEAPETGVDTSVLLGRDGLFRPFCRTNASAGGSEVECLGAFFQAACSTAAHSGRSVPAADSRRTHY